MTIHVILDPTDSTADQLTSSSEIQSVIFSRYFTVRGSDGQ